MRAVAADTHSLFWYLSGTEKLSSAANGAFASAEANGYTIFVPAIILVELRYLIEKGRTFAEADFELVADLLRSPKSSLTLAPLDQAVAEAVGSIARDLVPDMPDRLIAATALSLGVPLVTKDGDIRKLSNIEVIW